MNILSLKPGHDGTVCLLSGSALQFSLEAEKGSFPRYSSVTPTILAAAAELSDCPPDVLCISGWTTGWHPDEEPVGAGYSGIHESAISARDGRWFGKKCQFFSSSHERSHIMCAYGLSPFAQGEPCYALVWEGHFGNFYYIDENLRVTLLEQILSDPGNRYFFLHAVAEPTHPLELGQFRFEYAGKLMALAAYSDRSQPSNEERRLIDFVLTKKDLLLTTSMEEMRWTPFLDVGVDSNAFKQLAGKFSDALFSRFYDRIQVLSRLRLPLLIAGGCGLNCEWNTKWKESGLFSDVFVPPCPNDSGAAIGTAIDAQLYYTGNAKVAWSVYAGAEFLDDAVHREGFRVEPFSPERVADYLANGAVLALLHGRAEIGPRALGNRSLLASPFCTTTRDRLNRIKQREYYRPIAPVCLLEDVSDHFDWAGPSPHMLYFQRVLSRDLQAVTHVDGTARIQTVSAVDNPMLHAILRAFRSKTGVGVLCNTSFNARNRGFINSVRDGLLLCEQQGIDGLILESRLFIREHVSYC